MTAMRAFAIVGLGLAVVGAVGAIVVRIVAPVPFLPVTFGFGPTAMIAFIVMALSWASIGAFLVLRRPENAVGRLMVAAVVFTAAWGYFAFIDRAEVAPR